MTNNWSFDKITEILLKNWGQWSYLKTTISTKYKMSIPFGLPCGKNARYALREAIYTYFLTFLEFTKEKLTKKLFREKYFESVV